MGRTLREKLESLPVKRRTAIEKEAQRLHGDYLKLRELRRARRLTQARLAEILGVRQAAVAKYERQNDLLLSTLAGYVRAMGGSLKLMVEFPDAPSVELEVLDDDAEHRWSRHED